MGPKASDDPPDPPAVSESPPAAEVDIYERAYHEEVERIRRVDGREKVLYLTRRVEEAVKGRGLEGVMGKVRAGDGEGEGGKGRKGGGLMGVVGKVREGDGEEEGEGEKGGKGGGLMGVVGRVREMGEG